MKKWAGFFLFFLFTRTVLGQFNLPDQALLTPRNYILNGGAENGRAGWAAYADAAGTSPVDGTGGSPTVTITVSGSSPLAGNYSFLLTKDAANRQGQGVSYGFSIDRQDQGKVLNVSFNYLVSSGTFVAGTGPSSLSDVTIWVYDVTNAALTQLSPNVLASNSTTLASSYRGTFQTATNSTSYRLIFHCGSTSALAYTLKFDSLRVNTQITNQGPPVTDPQSFTMTIGASTSNPSKGTIVTDAAYWRRIGSYSEITYTYQQNVAGSGGTGTYKFSMPPGQVIDTSQVVVSTTAPHDATHLGTGIVSVSSANASKIVVSGYDANNLALTFGAESSVVTDVASGAYDLSNANVTYMFRALVPIVGWASNVVMSQDTDTRVVSAVADLASNVTPSANAVIKFDTVVYDTHAAYSTSSGLYTVQVPGKYSVSAIASSTGTGNLYVVVNGVNKGYLLHVAADSFPHSGSKTVSVNAGDTIAVYTDSNITILGQSPANSSFSIQRLTGPAIVASTETIAAKYDVSSTTVSNSVDTIVDFSNKLYDSHNAVTTGASWKFTAPANGKYHVICAEATNSTAWGNNSWTTKVYKNGSADTRMVFHITVSATYGLQTIGETDVQLLAGDYINCQSVTNFSSSVGLSGGGATGGNYISITRIGAY